MRGKSLPAGAVQTLQDGGSFHLPLSCVAVLGLGEVQDVLPGPTWCLLSTQQKLQLVGSKGLQPVHGEHALKATWGKGEESALLRTTL